MLDELRNIGNEIESKLIEIRKRIKAPLIDYSINYTEIDITGEKLQKLAAANPGEPIIIENQFSFAYIKDNTWHKKYDYDIQVNNHPNQCFIMGKKVHFYYCCTLIKMSESGRRDRYRAYYKSRNKILIDLHDENDVETRLAFCKNCIMVLCQKSNQAGVSPEFKANIAEYGNAKDLMSCVKAHYKNNPEAAEKTQDILNKFSLKGVI